MTTPPADTISTVAIAEILGVTRGTITNWKSRKADFPEPVAGTVRSPLYDRQEIFRWLIANGKATGQQLSAPSVGQVVVQLFDLIRSQGVSADVLSAATCYIRLSRNTDFPPSCRWTEELSPGEVADAIRNADQWARSSDVTYGMPIFAPLARALDTPAGAREFVGHILEQIAGVHDLEALHAALLHAARSTPYGEGSLPDDVATMAAQLIPDSATSILDYYCTSGSLVVACGKQHPAADLVAASPRLDVLESAVRWALIADVGLEVVDGDVLCGTAMDYRADAVVCHAPWGMRLSDRSRSMIRDTDPRWMFGTPRGDLHSALLQDAIYRLNPGGRAVVLCPKSVLFNNSSRTIREGLLRQGCLDAVISVPPGALSNTGIGFCVLILTRPGEATDTENVLLLDIDSPPTRGERPDFPDAVRCYRQWFDTGTVDADSGNAFRAPVRDIVAPHGSLDPTKWREAANRPDTDTLTDTLDLARRELENALTVTTALDTHWTPQVDRASRYATIGSLTDITIHRGVSLDRRVLDADSGRGVPVLSVAVLRGRTDEIRMVDPDTVRGRMVLTEPGDVITYPTPNGIVATVWDQPGWLPNSHSEILRITDPEAFDPEFLALCLSSRLITDPVTVGTVMPRAQSKNVTIPLIQITDQRSIVAYRRQVDQIAAQGQRLTQAADELRRALADAAASGITMAPS
ncbi:N-6 DNA methylase [Prescottella subtropica]|uniref:N-6 DNA methylase n=1 Tax=Prescottella subtropica TaxID=2545757 RepID=UPI0010F690E2|nr:N-6 DNA methylase [Prescottella subtropica]